MSKELQGINDLLDYVKKIGELNQRTIFKIEEYNKATSYENFLKNKKGIYTNQINGENGDPIWLRIDRLKRNDPPIINDADLKEWISISKDPNIQPQTKDMLIKTLTEYEVNEEIEKGIVKKEDVKEPLSQKQQDLKLKDVIYKIENLPDIKKKIENYIQNEWYKWHVKELPIRETIKIYEHFFNIHNTIHHGGESEQVELVWGTGIVRWNNQNHEMNFPLIEKLIDIDINSTTGAIELTPRIIDQKVQLTPFVHLENRGVDNVVDFVKKFYDESKDILFSPFEEETYEEVLRQAVTHLDSKGRYYPDTLTDLEDRNLPKIGKELLITDTWVVYLRPRESTKFIEDVKKFQDILIDKKDIETIQSPVRKIVAKQSNTIRKAPSIATFKDKEFLNSGSPNYSKTSDPYVNKQSEELYFPKPYNDAQEQIIKKLNSNNGVVVQGPPGTGKTHTIANIICHYLATGKKILVTSEHEPALSVVQEQLPEEIRKLAISILTDENQGNKQLERAINILQSLVTQTNTSSLRNQKDSLEKEVQKLKNEVNVIEAEIRDWSSKQMQSIPNEINDSNLDLSAMDLANEVMRDKDKHLWIKDNISFEPKHNPQFNEDEIIKLREVRQKIHEKIEYVDGDLFKKDDLPELAQIIAIHNDLKNSNNLNEKLKTENIPVMTESMSNLEEVLSKLQEDINYVLKVQETIQTKKWIDNSLDNELFTELDETLKEIIAERDIYVRNLIEITDPTDLYIDTIKDSLIMLKNGKNPFGMFSFGKKHEKTIIGNIKINSETPKTKEDWEMVSNFLNFQINIKKFLVKWNHIGNELRLPTINYSFGLLYPELADIRKDIDDVRYVRDFGNELKKTIIKVFPYGINTDDLFNNTEELKNIKKYIDINSSKNELDSQKNELNDLYNTLYTHKDKTITKKFRVFLDDVLGKSNFSTDDIQNKWRNLINELNDINSFENDFSIIRDISLKIEHSGGISWAKQLRTVPADEVNDELTPLNWLESWNWKRKENYIKSISGKERSKILFEERDVKEKKLQKVFTELIEINTNIGLKSNVTDLVKSALTKFQDAIRKIGKGTGKRAPRFKKDAQNAMKSCYGGIPCWIMPLWRISETLPSDFDMFDLVIIDEASQSDIRAITAILRAKKVLIVGDDKQVSPSVIGIKEETLNQIKHNFLREQPNASQLLPGSSIYDLARVIFPSQHIMLTEHFRCVEPIIRFSMEFYTEDLIPLRIPKSYERLDPPLIDVYVKGGTREKNFVNYGEVEAIIDEIKKITSNPKYENRTIGVVSLIGAKQAHEIQARLLTEIGEELYTKHKIFCGDASNFQGKEKDIIFLSMVVGNGQGVAMTKLENEQRFNVALSRARDRMYLYRSIEETDLKNVNDLKLKVIQHFKSPMPNMYENISDGLELCDSGFERDVYKRLDELGYRVRPQVSVGAYSIDLVVEDNDKRLAIELDGDRYHTAENWLDDWNRQRTLERVGWIFWRCWGSDYLIDPDGCIDDLVNRLNSLGIKPGADNKLDNKFVEHREYNILNNSSVKIKKSLEEENKISPLSEEEHQKNSQALFSFESKEAPKELALESDNIEVEPNEKNVVISKNTPTDDDNSSVNKDGVKVLSSEIESQEIETTPSTKVESESIITTKEEIPPNYFVDTVTDNDLRKMLKEFRDTEIAKEYVIDRKCILSDLMIEQFMKYKPVDIDEWYDIPKKLRESIDGDQTIYLEDIFEQIEMTV